MKQTQLNVVILIIRRVWIHIYSQWSTSPLLSIHVIAFSNCCHIHGMTFDLVDVKFTVTITVRYVNMLVTICFCFESLLWKRCQTSHTWTTNTTWSSTLWWGPSLSTGCCDYTWWLEDGWKFIFIAVLIMIRAGNGYGWNSVMISALNCAGHTGSGWKCFALVFLWLGVFLAGAVFCWCWRSLLFLPKWKYCVVMRQTQDQLKYFYTCTCMAENKWLIKLPTGGMTHLKVSKIGTILFLLFLICHNKFWFSLYSASKKRVKYTFLKSPQLNFT